MASSETKDAEEDTRGKLKRILQSDNVRFALECEFVEMLANPTYLHHLKESRFLDDPAFLNYINYLQYWREPKYAAHLSHPQCLFFLEMLAKDEFRAALGSLDYVELLQSQQHFHWRLFRAGVAAKKMETKEDADSPNRRLADP